MQRIYLFSNLYFFKASLSLFKKAWKLYHVYAAHAALEILLLLYMYLILMSSSSSKGLQTCADLA